MKINKTSAWGILLAFLCLSNFVFSQEHYKYAPDYEAEIYFGHVSYVDIKNDGQDPVVLGEGKNTPEVAVLNFPLGPGDSIITSPTRRCEIQFDTGTIIRLDYDTELKVETILAHSLTQARNVTNLVLKKGQVYVMYKRYYRRELFQIFTPSAAAKLNHNSVSLIRAGEDGRTDFQVNEGYVNVLYGQDEKHISDFKLKKNKNATVSSQSKMKFLQKSQDTDFGGWNQDMNDDFMETHSGKSFIPQPLKKYPKAVFYFAQKYSTIYGEWIWDGLYGYVWRPHYNTVYPSRTRTTWSPYQFGSWREKNGQMFWIPEESWGWVPYHLGLWTWNKNKGWLWIPGSAFAPAWVTWASFQTPMFDSWSFCGVGGFPNLWYWYLSSSQYLRSQDWFGWRPVSVFDRELWLNGTGFRWRYRGNPNCYPADFVELKELESYEEKTDSGNSEISKIRVKRITSYELPKDIKKIFAKVNKAIANQDAEVLADLRDMHRIYSAANPGQISSSPKSIQKTAPDSIWLQKQSRSIRMFINDQESRRSFRDWNPDIKAARLDGVSIKYHSHTNEIVCPELGMRSRIVKQMRKRGDLRGNSGSLMEVESLASSYASATSGSEGGDSRSSGSTAGSGSNSGKSGRSQSSRSNSGSEKKGGGSSAKIKK